MKNNEITLSDLTNLISTNFSTLEQSINRRFDENDRQHKEMFGRFERIEERLNEIDARLDRMEKDIRELQAAVASIRSVLDEVVTRREFEAVKKRVERMEKHLGLIKE